MKEIVIRPKSNFQLFNFEELWRYRELFYIFAWRDIKVRYKQTFLGIAWVIFQPLITMLIFTLIFGKLFKITTNILPYPLFVLSGLVFWNFFSNALSNASNSLLENENIIKKVYFPKIILPLSAIVTGFVDFTINLLLLIIIAVFFGFIPSVLSLIIFPIGICITALAASGLGLLLSSINVKYRDVRYILPFFIQLLLFLSPIIYPASIISSINKNLLATNPITGVIESIRVVIAGNTNIDFTMLGISFISSLAIFFLGLYIFTATEQFFADIL